MMSPRTWIPAVLMIVVPPAQAQMTVEGGWVVVSADKGAGVVGEKITIRKAGSGYEIVFDNGRANGGYSGSDQQISKDIVFTLKELKEDYSGVPEPVLRQVLGRAHQRFTLTVENEGRTLVRASNVGNITWTGNRLNGYDDQWQSQRVTYTRVDAPPAPAGVQLSSTGTGIFSCFRVDATKSGCIEVRNNSSRRVRLYLEELPGVQCTVDPGVYCSVPIAIGTYRGRIVADDDKGVGPTINAMIELTADGVRLVLEGDIR